MKELAKLEAIESELFDVTSIADEDLYVKDVKNIIKTTVIVAITKDTLETEMFIKLFFTYLCYLKIYSKYSKKSAFVEKHFTSLLLKNMNLLKY